MAHPQRGARTMNSGICLCTSSIKDDAFTESLLCMNPERARWLGLARCVITCCVWQFSFDLIKLRKDLITTPPAVWQPHQNLSLDLHLRKKRQRSPTNRVPDVCSGTLRSFKPPNWPPPRTPQRTPKSPRFARSLFQSKSLLRAASAPSSP